MVTFMMRGHDDSVEVDTKQAGHNWATFEVQGLSLGIPPKYTDPNLQQKRLTP